MPEADPAPLESPEAPWRTILVIVGGGVACVLITVALLGAFYGMALPGGAQAARPVRFSSPAPRLETNLFGTSQQSIRSDQGPPGIDAAMASVVAKGSKAYDPPGAQR